VKPSAYVMPAVRKAHWKMPSKDPTAPSFHSPDDQTPFAVGTVDVW